MREYTDYLASKRVTIPDAGFTAETINGQLFNWQEHIVRRALQRGRFCIFADTGLGKTRMQLAYADAVARHTNRRVIILAPLAVAAQTVAEGELVGIKARHARETSDIEPDDQIIVVNYERLERFTKMRWSGIVLDESSILKSYSGTMRQQIQGFADKIPYRLACTATPAPNDMMEMAMHSQFVGAMKREQIQARYFVNDYKGGDRVVLRLKRHAEREWYAYLSEISIALRKPSDIGDYSDDGYLLPEPLRIIHRIDDDGVAAEGRLFGVEARTLTERREAKRNSIDDRVEQIRKIVVDSEPDEQWIIWCHLNDEADALAAAIPEATEIRGSDTPDRKEHALLGFARGEHRVLITKPSIAGHGMNFQRCARVAFVGLDDSWEAFYQAVRRCHRFGQQRQVHLHIVASASEQQIIDNIQRKERQAKQMMDGMIDEIGKIRFGRSFTDKVEIDNASGSGWQLMLGDSAQRMSEMDENSIDISVFSPPFPGMYLYSNTEHDVGNARTISELVDHSRFIMGEALHRITKPGRMACVHMMQLPASAWEHGYRGVQDWRGPMINMMMDAGWIYAGEVTIDKNPQIPATRLKENSLLFKSLATDATKCRMALADYMIYFRKPGENSIPVRAGAHPRYNDDGWITPEEWIEWAAPVWYGRHRGLPGGISETDTLNPRTSKDEKDERHCCPLQLGVIERALKLWSAPGETVFSPFAGIGSEGVVALRTHRKFIGCELKRSYFEAAKRNLAASEAGQLQITEPGLAACESV